METTAVRLCFQQSARLAAVEVLLVHMDLAHQLETLAVLEVARVKHQVLHKS
jgi:hypothetical protein